MHLPARMTGQHQSERTKMEGQEHCIRCGSVVYPGLSHPCLNAEIVAAPSGSQAGDGSLDPLDGRMAACWRRGIELVYSGDDNELVGAVRAKLIAEFGEDVVAETLRRHDGNSPIDQDQR